MKVGQLEIELLANMARLQKDMADAKKSVVGTMQSISESVSLAKNALIGLGALGIASALAGQVKSAIDLADQLNKLSQRTGLTTETLSQLRYAAELSDVSAESLSVAIKKLNVNIAEGLAGDKQKLALFQALNISQRDLAKGTEAVMLKMAEAFAGAKDGAGKTAVAVGLLGKAGDEMIPLLNGGAEAIKQAMGEAKQMGLTISTDFAKQAEEFNDNLTRIKKSGDQLAITLGKDLVSALGEIVDQMAKAAVVGGKFAAVMAGLDAFGNKAFDWEKKQKGKGIQWLKDEIAELESTLQNSLYSDKSETAKKLAAKRQELSKAMIEIYAMDNIGGGRGSPNDPRIVNPASAAKREIKAPNTAAQSEYDAILKRVTERIDLSREELKAGRELTDQEKFETKVISDMAAAKKTLSPEQQKTIKARLEESRASDLNIQIQRSELKQAQETATERQRIRNADYEAVSQHMREMQALETSQIKLSRDTLEQLQFEASTLTMTTREREIAIQMRQLEQQGIKDGKAAYKEFADAIRYEIAAREDRKRSASAGVGDGMRDYFEKLQNNAEAAKGAVTRSLNGIEDALVNMAVTGKLSTRDLINTMLAEFYRLKVVRPFMESALSGGSSGNGLLGDLLSKAFGSGSVGGSPVNYNGSGAASSGAENYLASFAGGGWTGNGSRTGGLDGMGGFLALMHPREQVIDTARGQSSGAVYNLTFNGGVSRSEVMAGLAMTRAMARGDRIDDKRRGRL